MGSQYSCVSSKQQGAAMSGSNKTKKSTTPTATTSKHQETPDKVERLDKMVIKLLEEKNFFEKRCKKYKSLEINVDGEDVNFNGKQEDIKNAVSDMKQQIALIETVDKKLDSHQAIFLAKPAVVKEINSILTGQKLICAWESDGIDTLKCKGWKKDICRKAVKIIVESVRVFSLPMDFVEQSPQIQDFIQKSTEDIYIIYDPETNKCTFRMTGHTFEKNEKLFDITLNQNLLDTEKKVGENAGTVSSENDKILQEETSKEDNTNGTEVSVNPWRLQYIHKFGNLLSEICDKYGIKYGLRKDLIAIRGKKAEKAKTDIEKKLKKIVLTTGQCISKASQPPDTFLSSIAKLETGKQCMISVSSKAYLHSAWLEDKVINIVFLVGPLENYPIDVLVCPVTTNLSPLESGKDVFLFGGEEVEDGCKEILARAEGKVDPGKVMSLTKTGELACHSLCLVAVNKDNFMKKAKDVIKNIATMQKDTAFRSMGLAVGSVEKFSDSSFLTGFVKAFWESRKDLKYPTTLCLFADSPERLEVFCEDMAEALKLQESMLPVWLERWPDLSVTQDIEAPIYIEIGSILEQQDKVDVIVNSTNPELKLDIGGVSKMLTKAGGLGIMEDCKRKYPKGIEIGEVAVTVAGNLKCQKLFHGCVFSGLKYGDISYQIIKLFVTRCLIEAEERGFKSIAFPALGTGVLANPPCMAAKAMFKAVDVFWKAKSPVNLKTVKFVLYPDDKYIIEIFENVKKWTCNKRQSKVKKYDLPSKNMTCMHKKHDIKFIVAEKKNWDCLKYHDVRVDLKLVTNGDDVDGIFKPLWNEIDGCYMIDIRLVKSERCLQDVLDKGISFVEENKFHVVDVFLVDADDIEISAQKQLDLVMQAVVQNSDRIYQKNASKKSKDSPDDVNFVKVVRTFLETKDYCKLIQETEGDRQDRGNGETSRWYVSRGHGSCFKFHVEVIGEKENTDNVLKRVMKDISSAKVENAVMNKSNIVPVRRKSSENQVEEAPVQEKKITFDMSEDDYAALVYASGRETWFSKLNSCNYSKGKAVFDIKSSSDVKGIEECINSKLHRLQQFTTVEIIPPTIIKDQFGFLQAEVEKSAKGAYCFLSHDEKKILIRADGYELAQQAKHMVEVNLGMTSQGGGRRNRKFASPDAVGQGPVARQTSVPDSGIKDGAKFQTAEGIKVYIYCAGIGQLDVDTLVNAANKDLQHGGGIAYHISSAAGYALEKECDDIVRTNGSLEVGTCCSTTAGNLPYKSIIHAVGPMWHSYPHNKKQQCLDDLKWTVFSAINEAESQNLKSIAIPSISSGIFGVPKEVCAQQYYNAVVEYSKRSGRKSTIREIHFIDKDRGMCNLIQKTFEKEFGFAGQKM